MRKYPGSMGIGDLYLLKEPLSVDIDYPPWAKRVLFEQYVLVLSKDYSLRNAVKLHLYLVNEQIKGSAFMHKHNQIKVVQIPNIRNK